MNYEPEFCPKLRAIEVFPFEWEGKEVFLLRDPLGFSEGTLMVPKALGPLLAALDGRNSLRDLQVLASRLFGRLVMFEEIQDFIRSLDQHFFLEGERFEALRNKLLEEFRKSPVRPASHAGKSYPAEGKALQGFLSAILSRWPERADYRPRAIIAPHIDLSAGAEAFAAAYRGLSWPAGARVVVLGTGHFLEGPLSLLPKDFETPLGPVRCDREFIAALEKETGPLEGDLWAHRNEHSVEFQVIFLKYLLGDFSLVPILISSPTKGNKALLDRVAEAMRVLLDENTYFVAGVDFCHLGLRYGDERPAGEPDKRRALLFDHELLQKIMRLEAEDFYELLAEEEERYKVCGFGPLYFLLKVLCGRSLSGQVLHQAAVDFGPGSIVSFAAAALYDKKPG